MFSIEDVFWVVGQPAAVALGNLDNGGPLDIVTANRDTNTIAVLLRGEMEPFPTTEYLPVGNEPRSVAIQDLDNDDLPDIVAANRFDNTVSVLLGSGFGSSAPQQAYGTGVESTHAVLGDGALDVVTANEGSDTVTLLLGNGDATFLAPALYTCGSGGESPASSQTLALADFNVDVVTSNEQGHNVSVLLGVGDGTFAAQMKYDVGQYSANLALGAVNSLAGTPCSAVTTTFTVATSPPVVVDSSIADGDQIEPGPLVYEVQFSEPMDPATFTLDDMVGFTGPGGLRRSRARSHPAGRTGRGRSFFP